MKKRWLRARTDRAYWQGRLLRINGCDEVHGTKLFSILEAAELCEYNHVSKWEFVLVFNWESEKERDEAYEWLVNECLRRAHEADDDHFVIECERSWPTAFQALLFQRDTKMKRAISRVER